MKIERIRKNHKKKIVISVVIVLALVSTITLTMSKSKYRLTQSIPLVKGTINYKVPDLRIVAVNISEDGTNYEIANDVPDSGYTLNEERSICKVATETSGIENALIDRTISIEYVNGLINIIGVTKRNTRCYLYFDKYVEPTSDTTLAKLNINLSYIKEGNPDFSKAATGAETVADNGIYKMADPMYNGETYYWRGAATSNHVIFAKKCWRMVRINGDGSIRLIYNGVVQSNNTCAGNGYNEGSIAVTDQTYSKGGVYDNSAYVGYTYTVSKQRPEGIPEESNLKTQTDTWYNNNIGNNAAYVSHVADGKYCNDRNTGTGYTWAATGSDFYYGAFTRLYMNRIPTLSCDTNDVYELKVGAIIADEVSMAGGEFNTSNSSYYLYNGQNYWTMSPSVWAYDWQDSLAGVLYVQDDGSLNNASVNGITIGIRPVINLRSDITFNAGSNGTQNNPYIVQ